VDDPDLALLTVEDLRKLKRDAQEILADIAVRLANLPPSDWPAPARLHALQLRRNIEAYDREIEARLPASNAAVQAPAELDKPRTPATLFYSYSHKDEELRKELEVALALLRRQGSLKAWHDRQILPGEDWRNAINSNIESAEIILLLVSADFIASDYCYETEMSRALERNQAGEAVVIPVILRPTDWSSAPFAKLQSLPKDGKPVVTWLNRDEAWTDIVLGIRAVVNRRRPKVETLQEVRPK
jgi:TIR domain